MPACGCKEPQHEPRVVALTGGPGAGKTAVLEAVKRELCEHVLVLPETASILFGGGFPRHDTDAGTRAAQRAIYRVQVELERMTREEHKVAVILCDRGTVDGAAYWPGTAASFWGEVGTTNDAELARYDAVIHLRTPPVDGGYDRRNPVRTESAAQAAERDDRILAAWSAHPRRTIIDSKATFLDKLAAAVAAIRAEVPPCCQAHFEQWKSTK